MAVPDIPQNSSSPPIGSFNFKQLTDTEFLTYFKQFPDKIAKELLGNPEQLDRFWQLLSTRAPSDQGLIKAFDKVQNILGKIPPVIQPQPAPAPAPASATAAPPTLTAAQIVPPQAQPAKAKPIGPDNAKPLEDWLNGIKPGFHKYLADMDANPKETGEKLGAATARRGYTENFLQYFAMYRSQLGSILAELAKDSILEGALGPLGDLWHHYSEWDMQRKVRWMKNPLNANAFYYWFNSLPTQEAFKVAFIPLKAVWGIFSHTSGGLFTKAVYQSVERNAFSPDYGKEIIKESYFFRPLLRFSEGALKLANNLDRALAEPSPEIINKDFNEVLNNLQLAKKQHLSSRTSGTAAALKTAKRNLKNQLNQRDGSFLHSWSRPIRRNLRRRLHRVSQDPLNGLLMLLMGTIVDFTIGSVVNFVRAAISKAINQIPGLNTLRAQINEFFTSKGWFKFTNTFRVGGATIGSFGKALVSPTSFSSGYVGASAGGWVANSLGLPVLPGQIIGGGIGYGFGAFYKTSLNLAYEGLYNYRGQIMPVGWTQQYDTMLARATDPMLSIQEQNYWRGQLESNYYRIDSRFTNLRPGPITRFGNWLYNHPYARLPINGWVIGDLAAKAFGWNPWVSRIGFAAADYIWQVRVPLMQAFGNWYFTTPVGQWTLRTIGTVRNWVFYRLTPGALSFAGEGPMQMSLRPGWQWAQNQWAKIEPGVSNFLNPGFFLGIGLAPWLSGFMPAPMAYFVGSVGGSLAWTYGGRLLANALGIPFEALNVSGTIGWIFGSLAQLALSLLGFTQPWVSWLPTIGTGLGVLVPMLPTIIPSLGPIFGSFAAALGIDAAAMAIAATISSIALVAGLTVFFAYTIYAGFWVPMIEKANAGPESSSFAINSECQIKGINVYYCCSAFSLKENVLNALSYLQYETDIGGTDLTVDLADPAQTTDAWRDSTQLQYEPGGFSVFGPMNAVPTTKLYTNTNNTSTVNGAGTTGTSDIEILLSVPTDQPQTLFELMQQYQSVAYSMQPFFDILTQLAQEYKPCPPPAPHAPPCNQTSQLIEQYQDQLKILKEQKKLLEALIAKVETGNLDDTWNTANSYLDQMGGDPCPTGSDCPEDKQRAKRLYDSWQAVVNRLLTTIDRYRQQADPDLQPLLDSLNQELKAVQQQLDLLPGIIDQMQAARGKIDSQAEADAILNTNFANFFYLTEEEQKAAWELLQEYFPNVFNDVLYSFIPRGTNYKVCINMAYTGPTPAKPQTVCSSISYSPSVWGGNTAYAKTCTTFTPQ